jgi:hypothetical protein
MSAAVNATSKEPDMEREQDDDIEQGPGTEVDEEEQQLDANKEPGEEQQQQQDE